METMIEKQNLKNKFLHSFRETIELGGRIEIDLLKAIENKELLTYEPVFSNWFIYENPREMIKRICETHKKWKFVQINYEEIDGERIRTFKSEPDFYTEKIIIYNDDRFPWPKYLPLMELDFIIEYFLICESLNNCCGTSFKVAKLKIERGVIEFYLDGVGHYHS